MNNDKDFQSVDSEGQQKLFSKIEQGVLKPEAGLLPSLQEDRAHGALTP